MRTIQTHQHPYFSINRKANPSLQRNLTLFETNLTYGIAMVSLKYFSKLPTIVKEINYVKNLNTFCISVFYYLPYLS